MSIWQALLWAEGAAMLVIAYPYAKAILKGRPRKVRRWTLFVLAFVIYIAGAAFATALLYYMDQITTVWAAATTGAIADKLIMSQLGKKE